MVKGQLVFEFVISVILFFGIVLYIMNMLNTGVYGFVYKSWDNVLESKGIEITEVLLKQPGLWNDTVPLSPGFVVDWPVVNITKMVYFNTYCSTNYNDLKDLLGLQRKNFRLEAEGNVTYIVCGPVPPNTTVSYIRRIALGDNNDVISFRLWVW
ncbi:MAG: hypothetical protein DRP15_00660 [Candidatus Aenigmatarchaeota archaeon]|nr:MAG: hypothetical protein DRP15_00660 [Candidatus Aenigmarchaeota archaeon]